MSAYELNALTLKLDDAGNTAAHMAALKGREDMFKVRPLCRWICLSARWQCVCIFIMLT